jgi:hypothetical protein
MPNAQGRRGRPNASPYASSGRLGRAGKIFRRGVARAVTGGEYNHLTGENGGWKAAARYVGRGAGRMITRGAGVVLGGAVGITAGAATAMATGDVQNLWKGAAVGVGAGNKISSNLYDKGADFITGFDKDMKQELANEDSDAGREYNAQLRTEEAYKELDSELYNLPQAERTDYEKIIESMAPYVNIKTIEDAKALNEMKKANGGSINQDELKELYDDSSGMDVASHRDAYIKKKLMEMEISPGKPKYNEQQIEQMLKDRGNPGTPGEADYNDMVRKAKLVQVAQSIRK